MSWYSNFDPLILISSFISLLSIIILILVTIFNIRLRGVEYQIERDTILLEDCFGPLHAFFNLSELDLKSSNLPNTARYTLNFQEGLLEKIITIQAKYNFEIERLNSDLNKELLFIIKNTEETLKPFSRFKPWSKEALQDSPFSEDLTKQLQNGEKEGFISVQTLIICQINNIHNILSIRLTHNLELRENRRKLLKHLICPFNPQK